MNGNAPYLHSPIQHLLAAYGQWALKMWLVLIQLRNYTLNFNYFYLIYHKWLFDITHLVYTKISWVTSFFKICSSQPHKPLGEMLLQDSVLTRPLQNFTVCINFGPLCMTHTTWISIWLFPPSPVPPKARESWKQSPSHYFPSINPCSLIVALVRCHFWFLHAYGLEGHDWPLEGNRKRNESVSMTVRSSRLSLC